MAGGWGHMWIYLMGCTQLVSAQYITVLSINKQVERLLVKRAECEHLLNTSQSNIAGVYCPGTWDNVMCWNDTPAGVLAEQPCPVYINGFDQAELAYKECQEDGSWFTVNGSGKPLTNYTVCNKGAVFVPVDPLIAEHMPRVKLMYTIGYTLSLTFLVMAVAIMVYFKRLHCPRNMIHLNLFLAMLLRATISLMKGALLVNELGFPRDVLVTPFKTIFLDPDGPHWECRMFFALFNYSIMASVFWIFNEGLYLQLILLVSVFADKTKIRYFVLLGWGTPLLFVVPWVVARIYLDNVLCWNVYQNHPEFHWITHGPMVFSVFVNFIFFINIIRLLFTKLTATNTNESRHYRYRRLAKSTLILIPLFAVYYMAFIWLPQDLGPIGNVVRLYIELVFNSFQGFFIAMLFCFLNHEVQSEIKKKWKRHVLRRASSAIGRSFASTLHRGSKNPDLGMRSLVKSKKTTSKDLNQTQIQNGHLSAISEEKTPLRANSDCNDNKQEIRTFDDKEHVDSANCKYTSATDL